MFDKKVFYNIKKFILGKDKKDKDKAAPPSKLALDVQKELRK